MTGFSTQHGTGLFSRHQPGGFFSVQDVEKHPGRVLYVDSTNGTDQAGSGYRPTDALATIDYAIGQCVANEGDVIDVAPAHAETLTTKITADIAGIWIRGQRWGTLRPQITINANIDGIDVTAANVRITGLYFNEGTAAHTAAINVAGANCIIEDCHFDLGTNDLESITVADLGDNLEVRRCSTLVTADGPDAFMEIEAAGVDRTLVEHCTFVGSDGTNAFDAAVINSLVANSNLIVRYNHFSGDGASTTCVTAATATGLVVGPNYYGGSAVDADNATEVASVGSANDTTTDSVHGKLGTDTELADRSLYDLINGGGPAAAAAAAAPANDISLYAVARAVYNLVAPAVATGEADIDIDQADYTGYQNLITVAPAAGAPLHDAAIVFDLAKATTGFAAQHTTQTITFAVSRKVDGTNWRTEAGGDGESTAITGTNAAARAIRVPLGDVGVTEQVRVEVKLSAENAVDVELPYALSYKALAAPTVTPVAAV